MLFPSQYFTPYKNEWYDIIYHYATKQELGKMLLKYAANIFHVFNSREIQRTRFGIYNIVSFVLPKIDAN